MTGLPPVVAATKSPVTDDELVRFTDHAGTWISEDGWTRREVDGRPSYVTCSVCEAPVRRVTRAEGWCDECEEIANAD